MARAAHGVGFPVAHPLSTRDHSRPLFYAAAAGNAPGVCFPATAMSIAMSLIAQQKMEPTALFLFSPNPPIECDMGHPDVVQKTQPPRNLLGTPLHLKIQPHHSFQLLYQNTRTRARLLSHLTHTLGLARTIDNRRRHDCGATLGSAWKHSAPNTERSLAQNNFFFSS